MRRSMSPFGGPVASTRVWRLSSSRYQLLTGLATTLTSFAEAIR